MVKYDINPFKFMDIVTKIEKDLVKLAFLAVKGKFWFKKSKNKNKTKRESKNTYCKKFKKKREKQSN